MENTYTGLKVATFKERFNELCENNPQNASRIADDLRVSRQTVSAWRSGYRSPKEPTIIAIAKHFHVTVPWLMGFDVEKLEPVEETRPIFTPDSDKWRLIITNMTLQDYELVRDAFNRTERRLREEGKL